jgi:hypothetical protein
MTMSSGIPLLTEKGRGAIKSAESTLSARCRSVMVHVDGKRSLDDIRAMLRGLEGLDEAIKKLIDEGYIASTTSCKDLVKDVVLKQLGPAKGATILRKIDEMSAKYGDACWEHIDELDKSARLFYGETIAQNLKNDILKIVRETSK